MVVVRKAVVEKGVVAIEEVVERAVVVQEMVHHGPRLVGKVFPHQPLQVESLVERLLRHDRGQLGKAEPFPGEPLDEGCRPRIGDHSADLLGQRRPQFVRIGQGRQFLVRRATPEEV
jgi:hypothetical protein